MKKLIITASVFLLVITTYLTVKQVNNKPITVISEEKESINENYYIEDETNICAEMLEEIYRDEEMIYYLSCVKSETIILTNKETKEEITLKEAITDNLITIEELKATSIKIYEAPIIEFE